MSTSVPDLLIVRSRRLAVKAIIPSPTISRTSLPDLAPGTESIGRRKRWLPSDGCGSELDFWFKESTLHPPPSNPKPVLTLARLPPACKQIIKAP
jgi:hypothetical protein